MTSRTRKRSAAALAAFAVLAVSGCTFHPGSAVVINGDKISQTQVDNLVDAACSFFKQNRLKSGGASPQTSTAYLRNVITEDLISYRLTGAAASQLHLTVSPATIATVKASANQTLPAGMSSTDSTRLGAFFDSSYRSQLELAVIGAHLKDPSVMTADKVTQSDIAASKKYMASFIAKQHISVSPAFGTWTKGMLVQTDGSLSSPVSSSAKTWTRLAASNSTSSQGLPPSQVCG